MNLRKYASTFTLRNGILFKLSLEFFRLRVRPFIPIHILAIQLLRNVKKWHIYGGSLWELGLPVE